MHFDWERNSPPETGGVAAPSKKMPRSHRSGADGVVSSAPWLVSDHPVRSIEVASRHFLYLAATPPFQGGELLPSIPDSGLEESENSRMTILGCILTGRETPLLRQEGWLRQVRKCRAASAAAQTGWSVPHHGL